MADNHEVGGSSPPTLIIYIKKGQLAQLVEHSAYTGNVGGSSPSLPMNFLIYTIKFLYKKLYIYNKENIL